MNIVKRIISGIELYSIQDPFGNYLYTASYVGCLRRIKDFGNYQFELF